MKLEVGMYVRTKYGLIAKYIEFDDEYKVHIFDNKIQWFYEYYRESIDFKEWEKFISNYVVKVSHNIIDLIEVGDYVNGLRINSITEVDENHDVRLVWNLTTYGDDDISFSNEEIKSIVTKEQFESMQYEVKG